jgi:hypothetical protein
MSAKVTHLRVRSRGELTRSPITLRSLVRKRTSKMSGGASRPLTTADQNKITHGWFTLEPF